ncbi:EscU/YscU/HrcU family type III secretion system export apparatus switch protein [Helicobacter himalayensis]|uniref:EscU/YscU/HrcU family type III secretion system export apparatus switch protein n=1 Tax=Helicobacter himalayensis TaxID=1591088 RepID=UPI000835908A|nr:EscU/YscU/HrcU family type III secretion system export apparatus switch protein [Helicobacter himalayensis]
MKESIKNISKAAALAYNAQVKTPQAPRVLASGKGEIAQQIINKAKEFNVPLFSNQLLVDSLLALPLDSEIPPELYKSVAQVLVWIMDTEQKAQLSKQT